MECHLRKKKSYTFKASILQPNNHTAVCHEAVHSNDGKLDSVDNAKCDETTES